MALWTACPSKKQNGLIAFYGYSLVSMQRYLLLVRRRSDMCSCGCLGWSRHHAIFREVFSGASSLAKGRESATTAPRSSCTWRVAGNHCQPAKSSMAARFHGLCSSSASRHSCVHDWSTANSRKDERPPRAHTSFKRNTASGTLQAPRTFLLYTRAKAHGNANPHT